MKHFILCIFAAVALTHASPARADDMYSGGIGDFADGTVKSWADWSSLYGDCDLNKESSPGSVCAPAVAAWSGLAAIDQICTGYNEEGACISADSLDGLYGDTSASSPLAVSCQRGAANPPQDASCLVEGGTSQLKRRSSTSCTPWSECRCASGDIYPTRDRQCCTTTTWDWLPGFSVTTCARQAGGGCWNRDTWPCP